MHNIKVISYPRCGTQLLLWTLLRYASRNINYPNNESYEHFLNQKITLNQSLENFAIKGQVWFAGKIVYRDMAFNDNWQQVESILLHTHGDGIPYQNDETSRYIIQYRNPVEALASLFRLWPTEALQDEELIKKELANEAEKWKNWMKKWVDNNLNKPNVMFLEYNCFIENFRSLLSEILTFIGEEEKDLELLDNIIEVAKIKFYHPVYEDPIFQRFKNEFKEIQDKLVVELLYYHIPLLEFDK